MRLLSCGSESGMVVTSTGLCYPFIGERILSLVVIGSIFYHAINDL